MTGPLRVPRDVIAGGVILVLCAIAYAVTLTFKEAPAAVAMNVQPATFPRLVITVIAVLAVIGMALAFRQPDKQPKPIHPMTVLSAGMMIAFLLAFGALGIVPAMVLLCFFLPFLWGERRWKILVPYSILFPAAVYLLFAVVLKVHFDSSPLAFW